MNSIYQQISGTAFVLSGGILNQFEAKTSHGLIRISQRFDVQAFIDPNFAGQDAGQVLDGKNRNLPIYATFQEALDTHGKPDYCIVGVAIIGGILPPEIIATIEVALQAGVSVVNGLHDYLQSHPHLVELAEANGAKLIDIRKPKTIRELRFWSGAIYEVKCPIIAVMGLDCAVGKRTTALFIKEACERVGLKAEMIYTGQTGWLQGGKYGFILDSTLNDFVSGELEGAIIQAYEEEQPDLILIEGQSALRNPSGPCGSEFLLSGNARYMVLIGPAGREYFEDTPLWGKLPTFQEEIALAEQYGAQVIAVALNTGGTDLQTAKELQEKLHKELLIPVMLPLEEGVDVILPILEDLIHES